MSTDDVSEARESVEKEFGDIQKNLTAVRSFLHDLTSASPFDDVYELLEQLEGTQEGAYSARGPRGARKALEEYRQWTESPWETREGLDCSTRRSARLTMTG